ncbi:MAG TPA: hypothetical protein VFS43_43870 [Polyangiaceae bacterium]|nr:hypothetical protein [Polyangiaceae bacterium]
MRTTVANAARSLVALFALAPAFAACQATLDADELGPGRSSQVSEAEAARAEKKDECQPGETPERVCKDLPDGNVECQVVCLPGPQLPECDEGTAPVRACKPAAGADDECFILCLPDDQPQGDPDQCAPGTHLERVCEAPGPWPVPPFPGDPRPEPYPTDPSSPDGANAPDRPYEETCKDVCVPDDLPFPECPPGTFPEKVCRFDPETGVEECFVECLPDGGEVPPPECPDGTFPDVICKDVGDGEVVCERVCMPKDPTEPAECPDGTFPDLICKDVGNGEVVCERVCTPKEPTEPQPYPQPEKP